MKNFLWQDLIYTIPRDGEGGGAGGATAGGAAPPAVLDLTGIEPELLGHAQNRGWDKLAPKDAFTAALKAHREAEKHLGVPKEQILRLPKADAPEAELKEFHVRLGMPADPKDYKFEGADEKMQEALRSIAAGAHLTQDQNAAVTKGILAMQAAAMKEKTDAAAETLKTEKAALEKNWGTNFAINKLTAEHGANALGIKPEEVAALEGVTGYARIMDMFRKIGSVAKEDNFFGGSGDGGGGSSAVMTKEQAVARKAELMADEAFVKKYLNNDAASVREMTGLLRIITA